LLAQAPQDEEPKLLLRTGTHSALTAYHLTAYHLAADIEAER
jgi:hypothetical protein